MKRSIVAVGILLMGLLVIPLVIPPATAVYHGLWMPPQSHAEDHIYAIDPNVYVNGSLSATFDVRVVISDDIGVVYDEYGCNHRWAHLYCYGETITMDVYNDHLFDSVKINYEIYADGEDIGLNLVRW